MPTYRRQMLDYLQYCSDNFLSPDTLKQYRLINKRIYSWGLAQGWPQNATKITPDMLRDYYQNEAPRFKTGTQKLYLESFLLFLKWAGNQNLGRFKLRIKVRRTGRVNWISKEQVSLMIAQAPNPTLRAVIVCLAFTCMRVGELRRLRLSDMSPGCVVLRGKGRKERGIPIDKHFWQLIKPYSDWRANLDGPDLFLVHMCKSKGTVTGYSVGYIQKMIRNYSAKIGLPGVTAHTFRRSTCREMHRQKCPDGQLKEWMGHATVDQMYQYAGLENYDLTEALPYRPDY